MAVMTTQYSEAVALEQKTQPVPSSDKMALDLDINGTSTRDETNIDSTSDATINKPTLSPSNHVATDLPDVNGASNIDAFASNQTILPDLSAPAPELEFSSTSVSDPSQLQDTNTTTDAEISMSLGDQQPESALVSAESAIESAIEDVAPTSAVPPVVEAPESDLRDTIQAVAPEASLEEQSQANALDFDLDDHTLANQTADLEVDANSQGVDITFDPSPSTVPELPSDLQPPQQSAAMTDPNPAQVESNHAEFVDSTAEPKDTAMEDAPAVSAKVSREREDDDEAEPSAKRTKTDDAKMSLQEAPTQNGDTSGDHKDDPKLTPFAANNIIKIIKTVARSPAGKNFRGPVARLWPTFAALYAEKISTPIDLETMEHRLRDMVYQTMSEVISDIELLYSNALTFNGPGHAVTNAGKDVRATLLNKVPKVAFIEPAPAPKKDKKPAAKRSTPVPDAAPRVAARRPSRGSHGAVAPAAQPAQTFALDPTSNTPLIRRDSTKVDGGRPKREIHPPKNKDLPYSVRPKSKKHAHELKFCEEILTELNKAKYRDFVSPFQTPVDPVALGIPQYFAMIKKPMDLSTMSQKLKAGSYNNAADFDKDIRQMLWNCFKFNPVGNPVHDLGKKVEDLYNIQWAKKDQYLADRSPPAASPVSAGESSDEDEEEEEAAVDKSQESTLSAAKERLLEEQQKLITLMGAKHPDQGLIQMQKDMVGIIQNRISQDEAALKMKPKKVKAPKAAKKAPPPKKPAASKKASGNRQKYMGTLEKETISAGLGALPDEVSNEVLADIKRERPGIDAGEDGTLELDIDVISVPLLWKIHGLIMQYAPDVQEGIKKSMAADSHPKPPPKAAAPKKKNKPMSKYEQERNIDALSKTLHAYDRQTSGSQEPVLPTVEQQDESSGDEDSDSEEE
ncbi:Bromodomain-containing protein [Mollisia scopiformis]|uniref:Bromodomain-containing protein n=1 Tax=Mollisia scopiformis TaxID=149040 RepID=A0A194XDH4_MOLSC|nr:Bromodomain-containing protein [Mollisia scopiformis]KUJ18201.1 Bromodomain-containing protein [Mollisia scopiformis]